MARAAPAQDNPEPQMTLPALRVLAVMLKQPEPVTASVLLTETHLATGTLYPMLNRFRRAGWVMGVPVTAGTNLEFVRGYQLTEDGRAKVENVFRELHELVSSVAANL